MNLPVVDASVILVSTSVLSGLVSKHISVTTVTEGGISLNHIQLK